MAKAKKIVISSQYSKTYKTVENLDKAMKEMAESFVGPSMGFTFRYIVMTLENGRFQPIIMDSAKSGMVGSFIHSGFFVVS